MKAVFNASSIQNFATHYPAQAGRLRHQLERHPLFDLARLAGLARALPNDSVEYNAGDLPISLDPDKTPSNGLSAEETVRRIAENNSWIVLKGIEQDPDYHALLQHCLEGLEDTVCAATGAMHKQQGFIFITSPGSVTPFHMDPEHNTLLQIRGEKSFRIYPADDENIVSLGQQEAFHQPGGHRNLTHDKAFDEVSQVHALGPGDGLYVPVKAPHWVANGHSVSVSLSITWRSRLSDDEARLHRANGWLRMRGSVPPRPGLAPLRDRAVVLAHRLGERVAQR